MKIKTKVSELEKRILIAGFSKLSFVKAAGMSYQTLFRLLDGGRNASPYMAKKICETLKCEFDELFEIDNK